MKGGTLTIAGIVIIAVSISTGIIHAQYHELPQYPEDSPSHKVCAVIPPGWDESYGSIDSETGIPETEPNLTLYNREGGKTRTLNYLIEMVQNLPGDVEDTEFYIITPTAEQAQEFVDEDFTGYTIDGVFVPIGHYPVNTAIILHDTGIVIGADEDCVFDYVEITSATPQPTPTPSNIILRPLDDKIPESIQDRTERIAAIAIIGVLRGIHIGVTIAP